jgi:hypothetical protein
MKSDTEIECGGHRTFQADVFDEVRAALGDVAWSQDSDSSVRASGGLLRGKRGTRLQTGIGGSSGGSRAWRRTRSCWLRRSRPELGVDAAKRGGYFGVLVEG